MITNGFRLIIVHSIPFWEGETNVHVQHSESLLRVCCRKTHAVCFTNESSLINFRSLCLFCSEEAEETSCFHSQNHFTVAMLFLLIDFIPLMLGCAYANEFTFRLCICKRIRFGIEAYFLLSQIVPFSRPSIKVE